QRFDDALAADGLGQLSKPGVVEGLARLSSRGVDVLDVDRAQAIAGLGLRPIFGIGDCRSRDQGGQTTPQGLALSRTSHEASALGRAWRARNSRAASM